MLERFWKGGRDRVCRTGTVSRAGTGGRTWRALRAPMALEAALDASVALARIINAHAAVRAGYAEAIARLAARGALLHVPIHWDSVVSDRDAADRR